MAKRAATAGLLTALALALGYLEHLLPLQLLVPLPGIKLGLSNIVTLFALIALGKRYAFSILLARCLLQGMLFGSVPSLAFSLSGGILSMLVMSLLKQGYPSFFSVIGISAAGATCHQIGQIICAGIFFQSSAVLAYLPVLLAAGGISGCCTGLVGQLFLARSAHMGLGNDTAV